MWAAIHIYIYIQYICMYVNMYVYICMYASIYWSSYYIWNSYMCAHSFSPHLWRKRWAPFAPEPWCHVMPRKCQVSEWGYLNRCYMHSLKNIKRNTRAGTVTVSSWQIIPWDDNRASTYAWQKIKQQNPLKLLKKKMGAGWKRVIEGTLSKYITCMFGLSWRSPFVQLIHTNTVTVTLRRRQVACQHAQIPWTCKVRVRF
jgi:hypothetical protein